MVRLWNAVTSSIQALLDIVLPRKDRVIRAEQYSLEDIVVAPAEHNLCGISITTLLSYREKAVEDCIRAVKYDHSIHAAKLLAEVLAEFLREEIAQHRSFSSKPICLIPIPLHANRYAERGFNQMEFILEQLSHGFHDSQTEIHTEVLVRVRETTPQTHLSRPERLKNVTHAFAVERMEKVLHAHVILIDDVVTTGSTLASATRSLTHLGISVTSLALARA